MLKLLYISCKNIRIFFEAEMCFLSLFQNLVCDRCLKQSVQNLAFASYVASRHGCRCKTSYQRLNGLSRSATQQLIAGSQV